MNKEFTIFKEKTNQFLLTRGFISKKTKDKDFVSYFQEALWYSHCESEDIYGNKDGLELLDLLGNDSNLLTSSSLVTNFSKSLDGFSPSILSGNRTWTRFGPRLISFKGKGCGIGERYLELIVPEVARNLKTADVGTAELKAMGASLKPQKKIYRKQDDANKNIFCGYRAGNGTGNAKNSFNEHRVWIKSTGRMESIYDQYFTEIYPESDRKDIQEIAHELSSDKADDISIFNFILGCKVIKWYKEIDKWVNLVILDQDKQIIHNITDVSESALLQIAGLEFKWKSNRGADTQAISDGYINISIT